MIHNPTGNTTKTAKAKLIIDLNHHHSQYFEFFWLSENWTL